MCGGVGAHLYIKLKQIHIQPCCVAERAHCILCANAWLKAPASMRVDELLEPNDSCLHATEPGCREQHRLQELQQLKSKVAEHPCGVRGSACSAADAATGWRQVLAPKNARDRGFAFLGSRSVRVPS